MSVVMNMLTVHEAKIQAANEAMLAAYAAGEREDAYHHWSQVVRFIKLRSPVVVEQMERRMGLTGAAPTKGNAFYSSDEWRAVRYQALTKHGNRCQCCGRGRGGGLTIHVDHIKPRSKFPWLALEITNLQVLCSDCNLGKSNVDETDWRAE